MAYNPATNQISDRRRYQPTNQSIRSRRSDTISYRSLNNHHDYGRLKSNYRQEQRSADNLLYSNPQDLILKSVDIYSEPVINDSVQRSRAQPQVPIYRKMGRRASEGSTLSDKDIYADISVVKRDKEMVVGDTKDVSKTAFMAESTQPNSLEEMPVLTYPSACCRLSLDDAGDRRQSSASLSSSMADGSKDSLSSYDSSSTITGQDPDEQIYMTKLRKSVQKKEEFLSNNNSHQDNLSIQKVFYGRPGKLTNPIWPPLDQTSRESPSRNVNVKPTHQNFQRVKNDIDNERDYTPNPKWNNVKIQEASPAPAQLENPIAINGANAENCYQMVHKTAKQFESGKPMIEDPLISDRTSFYKSELSRISEKKVQPTVPDRAREFELMTELQRDNSTTSTSTTTSHLRRNHRDTRSLESSGN